MSFISDYQSIKTLLATKLNNKLVSANNNEGLTTLINKVSTINSEPLISNGLIVVSDKSELENNESANVTVLLLDEHYLIYDTNSFIGIIKLVGNYIQVYDNSFLINMNGITVNRNDTDDICELTSEGLHINSHIIDINYNLKKNCEYHIHFDVRYENNDNRQIDFSFDYFDCANLNFSIYKDSNTTGFHSVDIYIYETYTEWYFGNEFVGFMSYNVNCLMDNSYNTYNIELTTLHSEITIKNFQIYERKVYGFVFNNGMGDVESMFNCEATMTNSQDLVLHAIYESEHDEVESKTNSIIIEYKDND